jgi:hypothetical protein
LHSDTSTVMIAVMTSLIASWVFLTYSAFPVYSASLLDPGVDRK